MTSENHPVWGVYDLLRTARLNVKYYSAKLHRAEIVTSCMDFILLVSAPTSVVAGLWFWSHPVGKIIWQYLGAIAAFFAVLKPILGMTKKIKAYEELRSGYRALEHDLYEIKEMITQKRKYDKQLQEDFRKAIKRKGILVSKDPDYKENKRLKAKCEKEVGQELPVEAFYIPEEENNDKG